MSTFNILKIVAVLTATCSIAMNSQPDSPVLLGRSPKNDLGSCARGSSSTGDLEARVSQTSLSSRDDAVLQQIAQLKQKIDALIARNMEEHEKELKALQKELDQLTRTKSENATLSSSNRELRDNNNEWACYCTLGALVSFLAGSVITLFVAIPLMQNN